MSKPELDISGIVARLAVRSNLSLGSLMNARFDEFRVLLASAAGQFEPGRGYREREVNEWLKSWLAGTGVMLATDHVELRRWLVDTGCLERDGFGRRYARNPAPGEPYAAAMAGLDGLDVAGLVDAARSKAVAERAERKARFAPGTPLRP